VADIVHEELRDGQTMGLYRDYVRAMYVMFKSAFLYETNNDALRSACERVSSIANKIHDQLDDVAALELLPEGAYVNRVLIKLDTGLYDQTEYLLAIFSTLGLSTVSALDQTTIADWIEVISLFKRCVGPGGDFTEFAKTTFPRIRISVDKGQGAKNALSVTSKFRALRAYATTVITLNEVLDALRQGRRLRPLWIKRPLQEMVSVSGEAGDLLLALAQLKRHKLTLAHHLANSAVFAVCAVKPLGLPRRLVAQLAMEAALHDLGRAFAVETDPLQHSLADRRYALESVRKLVTSGTVGDRMMARVVVANEVRRWASRRGEPAGDWPYPFGLGERTKIVAVAHAYSMLTTHLRERPSLLPDDALRVIMAESGRRYDAVAVKLFVNALGIYPVGSTVALSDRRAAVVVESPREVGSGRPRIKIVRDNEGSIIDGPLVDLAGEAGSQVRIVQCIDGEMYEVNAPAFLLS
jgi:HD-GYP domain-containing protein (c-di-GMP phosphodiesterase class II)